MATKAGAGVRIAVLELPDAKGVVKPVSVYAQGDKLRFGHSSKYITATEHPRWQGLGKGDKRKIRRELFRAGHRALSRVLVTG